MLGVQLNYRHEGHLCEASLGRASRVCFFVSFLAGRASRCLLVLLRTAGEKTCSQVQCNGWRRMMPTKLQHPKHTTCRDRTNGERWPRMRSRLTLGAKNKWFVFLPFSAFGSEKNVGCFNSAGVVLSRLIVSRLLGYGASLVLQYQRCRSTNYTTTLMHCRGRMMVNDEGATRTAQTLFTQPR